MAAIYQWFSKFIRLVTTLYPVDAAENMEVSCEPVDDTRWAPLPQTDAQNTFVPLSGTLKLIYFLAPEQGPESAQNTFVPLSGTLRTIYFLEEVGPEKAQNTFVPLSGTLEFKLVYGDSPDEKLEISCTIESDCSMTTV